MSDNPLDDLPVFDRVSVRAVLVHDGEDAGAALAQAGIFDAVAIPVVVGGDAGSLGNGFGDGITDNLTGVLEPDKPDDLQFSNDVSLSGPPDQAKAAGPAPPGPAVLPAAYGLQPLAPVRKRGG